MEILIEIKKHENKDYTLHIYEGINYFQPALSIRTPMHWNKCVQAISQYLRARKMINVYQKSSFEKTLLEAERDV